MSVGVCSMPHRIVGALFLLVSVSSPLSAGAQVFNDVIGGVFSIGAGVSCDAAGVVPVGGSNLGDLCAADGVNLAGPSNSTTSGAITNVTAAAPTRAEKVVGPMNIYIAADYEHFDKDVTTFEPGYKNYIWRGAVGADFAVDKATLGGALRYQHDNGKFDHQNGAPKFETNSYGAVLYANLTPTPVSFLAISVGVPVAGHVDRPGGLLRSDGYRQQRSLPRDYARRPGRKRDPGRDRDRLRLPVRLVQRRPAGARDLRQPVDRRLQ